MNDAIDQVKTAARVLQRQAQALEPTALQRVRRALDLRDLADEAVAEQVRRRHCLAALAWELGFGGWPALLGALRGTSSDDFGTLLYPSGCGGLNIWSADYEEARAIRRERDGYLLGYRHQFFVTDEGFIADLGLDPRDPDWERMGRDWVRPADPPARGRLYAQLLRARLGA